MCNAYRVSKGKHSVSYSRSEEEGVLCGSHIGSVEVQIFRNDCLSVVYL